MSAEWPLDEMPTTSASRREIEGGKGKVTSSFVMTCSNPNSHLQSFSAAFPRNAATVRAPSPAESCREVQRRQYRLTFLLKGTGPAAGIQPPQHSASKAGPTLQGKSSRGASFTSVKQLREHWRFGRFRASRFGNPGRASPPGRLPETLDPSHFGRFPRLVKSAHGKG